MQRSMTPHIGGHPDENRTQRYTRWVIRHRWWVLGLALATTIAAASGMPRLGLATDYRVFFSEGNPDGDELIVEDLVGTGEITAAAADRARDVALTEPLLANRLVSEDAGATGVNVRISLPGESADELPATVEHVRMLLDQYRAEYPDVEIHASGISMLNSAFAEAPLRDLPVVFPLMFGALLLAIVLFLRTFSGGLD